MSRLVNAVLVPELSWRMILRWTHAAIMSTTTENGSVHIVQENGHDSFVQRIRGESRRRHLSDIGGS